MKPLIPILLLAACNTAFADYASCMSANNNDPKYAPLSKKMAVHLIADQTFEMLANTTYATEEEKPLIASWITGRMNCYNADGAYRAGRPLPVQNLMETSQRQIQAATADLYSGKLTYGDFAKRRTEIQAEQRAGLNAAREANDRNRQAQQARDEQRQQAEFQMLMNMPPLQIPQQQPYQMPIPKNTNCTMIGNQMNCTTR